MNCVFTKEQQRGLALFFGLFSASFDLSVQLIVSHAQAGQYAHKQAQSIYSAFVSQYSL